MPLPDQMISRVCAQSPSEQTTDHEQMGQRHTTYTCVREGMGKSSTPLYELNALLKTFNS